MRASQFFRGVLLVFVVVFSIWPFYIDLRLHDNVGLNPQRIVLFFAVIFFAVAYFLANGFSRFLGATWWRNSDGKAILGVLLVYTVLRSISSALAGTYSLLIFVNELISNMFLMVVAGAVFRRYSDAKRFVSVITVCALIVSCYAVIERAVEYNFLVEYADVTTRAGFTAATEKIRDGVYRVQGTFEHPLSLVQYLAMTVPLLYLVFRKWKALAVPPFLIICAALLYTGSRSAIVALFLSMVAMLVLTTHVRLRSGSGRRNRGLILGSLVALYGVILVGGGVLINEAVNGESDSQNASTATRLIQINNGLLAIKQRPIFGFGPGEASRVIMGIGETESGGETIFRETTDNLFLTRVVESGIPSVLALIYLIYRVLKLAVKCSLQSGDTRSRDFNVAVFGAIVAGVTLMTVLSIFTVLPLFFILMGVVLGFNTYASKQLVNDTVGS
jgi:O-antigen ligase